MNFSAKKLKLVIAEKGISNVQLAEKLGVSANSISRWLAGAYVPKDIARIAQALGCRETDLYDDIEAEESTDDVLKIENQIMALFTKLPQGGALNLLRLLNSCYSRSSADAADAADVALSASESQHKPGQSKPSEAG